MPRRVTVYLEAPPGDGLRVAQDHFAEYVKPVLASSGLDWDFVVGRREGDVRAVVAEKIRRGRRSAERDMGRAVPDETTAPDAAMTEEDTTEAIRKRNGIAEYAGIKGDIIVGRHTWKEYVRGLHEGWLGPLVAPPPAPEPEAPPASSTTDPEGTTAETPSEEKPKPPPPQPQPYITTTQYPSSSLPLFIPAEFAPSTTIRFTHLLGFLSTPTRMRRFLTRRYLADEIGREVAAVCFTTYREYREDADGCEQEGALQWDEKDWLKSVWKDEAPPKDADGAEGEAKKPQPPKEKIWATPVILDPRIAVRMRRFELLPDDEAQARRIVVPEEEIEGWMKRNLRHLGRWGAKKWRGEENAVRVGNLDDVD